MTQNTHYTFGTTEAAADRLATIADFFNPPAARFVRAYMPGRVACAIDLGCGPGYTTAMLAHATNAPQTVGLDNGTAFLAIARRRHPHVSFIEHDVTATPFPVSGQVMFARFVLAHLNNPVDVVKRWCSQLTPGGVLLVEDGQAIDTSVDAFRRYLDINEGLVASQGSTLYVGRCLAEADYEGHVLYNDAVRLPVSNALAARWFVPNTQTIWHSQPWVQQHTTADQREQIARELIHIRDSGDQSCDSTWTLRRLAIRI